MIKIAYGDHSLGKVLKVDALKKDFISIKLSQELMSRINPMTS